MNDKQIMVLTELSGNLKEFIEHHLKQIENSKQFFRTALGIPKEREGEPTPPPNKQLK